MSEHGEEDNRRLSAFSEENFIKYLEGQIKAGLCPTKAEIELLHNCYMNGYLCGMKYSKKLLSDEIKK